VSATVTATTRIRRRADPIDALYTKNGRLLRVSGKRIFNGDGLEVTRVRCHRALGPNGRYMGTVVDGRLIYRATRSASVGSSFARDARPMVCRLFRLDIGDVRAPLGALAS
jgi:hypothetical protein